MDDDTKIVEGEVAESAETLVTITGLIQNYLSQINETKGKLTEYRQMIDDALNNDETYTKHTNDAKEANKIKLTTKKQLMSAPNMRELSEKVKDLNADLKAAKESLSQYLAQYRDMTKSNQFEDGKGEVLDIVVKLTLQHPKFS